MPRSQLAQHPIITIDRATSSATLDHIRALMHAFVAWHRVRHQADMILINRYFDQIAFERELNDLPGQYAAPHGALLIAHLDGKAAGCVALRNLGVGICEMKRMFVAEEYRGLGVGRALLERVVAQAGSIGYRAMRLDTSRHQLEAISLYASAGFRRIPPYYAVPKGMEDWLVFYEKSL